MKPIYTSCWAHYSGPGRVGISQGTPRFGAKGYRLYKALAPTWDILNTCKNRADYRKRFFREILGQLDPAKTIADLYQLGGDHPPVMLCYERPPFSETNWCHRHMVAEWIEEKSGIVVDEWQERVHRPLHPHPEVNGGQAWLDL